MGRTTNPDQTAIDPSFGVKFFDHQRNATVRLAHTFSPQLRFDEFVWLYTQHAIFSVY